MGNEESTSQSDAGVILFPLASPSFLTARLTFSAYDNLDREWTCFVNFIYATFPSSNVVYIRRNELSFLFQREATLPSLPTSFSHRANFSLAARLMFSAFIAYCSIHKKNLRVLLRNAHWKCILGLGLGVISPRLLIAQISREARGSARAYYTNFNFPAHVFSYPTRFLTFMRRHGLFLSQQCSLLSRICVIRRVKLIFLIL